MLSFNQRTQKHTAPERYCLHTPWLSSATFQQDRFSNVMKKINDTETNTVQGWKERKQGRCIKCDSCLVYGGGYLTMFFFVFFFNQGMSVRWYLRFFLQVLNYGAETWDSFLSSGWWEVHPSLLCWRGNLSEYITVDINILGIHFEFMRHPRTARIVAMLMWVLLFCIETQAFLDWFGWGSYEHLDIVAATEFFVTNASSWGQPSVGFGWRYSRWYSYHKCRCSRKSMPQWRSFQP